MSQTPSILFVCLKNSGKSQTAAGLMRQAAGETVEVDSAGTTPGDTINAQCAQTLLEVSVNITDQHPKQLTPAMIAGIELMRLVRDDIGRRIELLTQELQRR